MVVVVVTVEAIKKSVNRWINVIEGLKEELAWMKYGARQTITEKMARNYREPWPSRNMSSKKKQDILVRCFYLQM